MWSAIAPLIGTPMGAGHKTQAHDKARGETRACGHQLLRHHQHQGRSRSGEKSDEDGAQESPRPWEQRVQQDRGRAQDQSRKDHCAAAEAVRKRSAPDRCRLRWQAPGWWQADHKSSGQYPIWAYQVGVND